MTFGTKLHKLREKNRLSQQEVADLIGVSQNTYSRWESDLSTFKVEYLTKLAEVFEVDAAELILQSTTDKVANNKDNNSSVNSFDKELYKDLLESKNEVIRLLKEENSRLKGN